ncbi:MAG: 2-C-methyl-D-erythritol 4-phosphate cytidylyltransferase, partial [Ktedonobacterales bacterium]|nr:2-C-methyl-D-erythritol 4-phosphate cytidylyltransferase [Ktedonobacterales bacterium]
VIATLSRERLVGTQTPQIFARTRLLAAHLATDQLADFADDAALAYAAGIPLATYPGSHENLQVTTPDDLPIVSALLLARQG